MPFFSRKDSNGKGIRRDFKCVELDDFLRSKGIYLPRETLLPLCASLKAGKPMMFEGSVGTGKTMTAKALAEFFGKELRRVTAYPDIMWEDLFGEWDYKRQLLDIQAGKSSKDVFTEEYFKFGEATKALKENGVLLVDEVNRGGDVLQNYLLELSAEKQVSIPNLGTVKGDLVLITTYNYGDIATSELSQAFKRRFARIEFKRPDIDTAIKIANYEGINMDEVFETITKHVHVEAKPKTEKAVVRKPELKIEEQEEEEEEEWEEVEEGVSEEQKVTPQQIIKIMDKRFGEIFGG